MIYDHFNRQHIYIPRTWQGELVVKLNLKFPYNAVSMSLMASDMETIG